MSFSLHDSFFVYKNLHSKISPKSRRCKVTPLMILRVHECDCRNSPKGIDGLPSASGLVPNVSWWFIVLKILTGDLKLSGNTVITGASNVTSGHPHTFHVSNLSRSAATLACSFFLWKLASDFIYPHNI